MREDGGTLGVFSPKKVGSSCSLLPVKQRLVCTPAAPFWLALSLLASPKHFACLFLAQKPVREILVLTLLGMNISGDVAKDPAPVACMLSPFRLGFADSGCVGLQDQLIKIRALGYLTLLPLFSQVLAEKCECGNIPYLSLLPAPWKVFPKRILSMPQRVCVPVNQAPVTAHCCPSCGCTTVMVGMSGLPPTMDPLEQHGQACAGGTKIHLLSPLLHCEML